MINASHIMKVTKAVTKEWTKARKAEERGSRSRHSRGYIYSDRVNFTDVLHRILPQGYQHASGNGRFTVSKRHFYYAVREQLKQATGRPLTKIYFDSLLLQYMNRHPETDSWKVTADPRGALIIPNAAMETRIPCGTVPIDDHLVKASRRIDPLEVAIKLHRQWPSLAGGQRYQAVLYIEKEGFEPMIREARIAERFNIAILSCKGQSVKAARKFVDVVCRADGGVPLFVVHDFDKAGFEISQRLTRVSDWAEENDRVLYRFENDINVTDLGLRLRDVEKYGLASEESEFSGYFASDSICTAAERKYLQSGRRVELNAFTAPQFIEWIETKLSEQGLGKPFVPDDETLNDAYRRAVIICRLNAAIDEALADVRDEAEDVAIPKSLKRQLHSAMKVSPESWDLVLYALVKSKLYPDADD
jgi:hypothetical protein